MAVPIPYLRDKNQIKGGNVYAMRVRKNKWWAITTELPLLIRNNHFLLSDNWQNKDNRLLSPDSGVGSLAVRRFKVTESLWKFNSNSNGADTVYICKHSACLHAQKC